MGVAVVEGEVGEVMAGVEIEGKCRTVIGNIVVRG